MMIRTLCGLAAAALLVGCGTLDKQAATVNPGDSRDQVVAKMGAPDDRQFRGDAEAWQYCKTGAGFGYHDHRIVWFKQGAVTGMNSYKSTRPGTSCVAGIRPVVWEDAPNATVEIRQR
jgi:hypothetical protein